MSFSDTYRIYSINILPWQRLVVNEGAITRAVNLKLISSQKKTRSSGRITSLGQPSHRDNSMLTKRVEKVNPKRGALS